MIAPASTGMKFWLAFAYAGARAIGLRERLSMNLEGVSDLWGRE